MTRRREDGRTGHKCQGWTVFHLPSTPWSLSAVGSSMCGSDFKGLPFDLAVFLPRSARLHGSRHRASRSWRGGRASGDGAAGCRRHSICRRPYRFLRLLMSPRKSSRAGCSERGAWPHAAAASGRIADLDASAAAGVEVYRQSLRCIIQDQLAFSCRGCSQRLPSAFYTAGALDSTEWHPRAVPSSMALSTEGIGDARQSLAGGPKPAIGDEGVCWLGR